MMPLDCGALLCRAMMVEHNSVNPADTRLGCARDGPWSSSFGIRDQPKGVLMTFVQAISSCFRNYATFSGRAVRSEFWYWYLFVAIILAVFGGIDQRLYPGLSMGPFTLVNMAVVLALILPSLAVSVRRLHDIDRTGWWILISVTVIGTIVLIYWACLRGAPGPNRFGNP